MQLLRRSLVERELVQPFKQAYREIYLLAPGERETRVYSNRFAAHVLHYPQTYALVKERGWGGSALGPGTAATRRRCPASSAAPASAPSSFSTTPIAHLDYWSSFSFGKLDESAEIRREVLAELIPKLRIADRLELHDRSKAFLLANDTRIDDPTITAQLRPRS